MLTRKVLGVLLVDDVGEISTIVENHVQGLTVLETSHSLFNAPLILLLGLTLPREDGHTGRSNSISVC
jgi:hypothetical protein